MKKIALFLIPILISNTLVIAQKLEWVRTFGGVERDGGDGIAVDVSGNVYTVGSFYGSVDFDPSNEVAVLTAEKNYSMYIQKLNSSGGLLWVKKIEMAKIYYSRKYSITLDVNDNIYITGAFEGTVDFDPNPDSLYLTAKYSDIFVQKLNSKGDLIWVKSMKGTLNYPENVTTSIAVDKLGNVYTTGVFSETVDFNPNEGIYNLTGSSMNAFIQKLDIAGNFVWVKQIGDDGATGGSALVVDDSGNIYTTGYFSGIVDFDPNAGTTIFTSTPSGYSSHYSKDIFIQKLDTDGNLIWIKSIGSEGYDTGNAITIDDSGNIYTTGAFYNTVDFDPGSPIANLSAIESFSDIYVQKLDNNGKFIWAKRMGGNRHDKGNSISVDEFGYVYTCGVFNKTVDFDPNFGTTNLTAPWGGVFIQKLDPDGDLVWAKSIEATTLPPQYYNVRVSMTVDRFENIYTTGFFSGTVDFDPNTDTTYLSARHYDIFIQKLSTKNPLGIEPIKQSKIKLYPNPTNDLLNIELPATAGTAQFSIVNYTGQVVRQGNLNRSKKVVNLSSLSAGIYQVNMILSSGEKYFEKIVLTK